MSRKNFNWHYKTAHEGGTSHVVDQRREEIARVRGHAMEDRNKKLGVLKERQREREDFLRLNPHMLPNVMD